MHSTLLKTLPPFLRRPYLQKKGIALALGAGGFKGFFHIGVLEALEIAEIPVSMIVGASAGSLAGAAYCAGLSIEKIKEVSFLFKANSLFKLGNPMISAQGLMKGEGLKTFIDSYIGAKNFSDLKIPLFVVATELVSGRQLVISEGNVAEAVRASISLPVFFEPVLRGGKALIDGGVAEYVPVTPLRRLWKGPMLASWLVPPGRSTEVKITHEDHGLTQILRGSPFLKDWKAFQVSGSEKLEGNMAGIMMRAWDIMASEKSRMEILQSRPDIIIAIDPDINPGINEMTPEVIGRLMDEGRRSTLAELSRLKIYKESFL